jgi:hypothetical protein
MSTIDLIELQTKFEIFTTRFGYTNFTMINHTYGFQIKNSSIVEHLEVLKKIKDGALPILNTEYESQLKPEKINLFIHCLEYLITVYLTINKLPELQSDLKRHEFERFFTHFLQTGNKDLPVQNINEMARNYLESKKKQVRKRKKKTDEEIKAEHIDRILNKSKL